MPLTIRIAEPSAVVLRLVLWIVLTRCCGFAQTQSSSLSALLGGSATAFDSAGNLYFTGQTTSSGSIPVTPGAFQTTFGPCSNPNGCGRGYVIKISADGKSILYATYIGGSGNDSPAAIAVDSSGSVYITGFTTSPNFPVTSGTYQNTAGEGFPFEIASAATSSVAILNNGAQIQYQNLSVAAAVPAIFPVGSGYAILNQDGTLNSQTNPAAIDSVVSVFGTGAGLLTPLPPTGSIGLGQSVITATVSVTLWFQAPFAWPPILGYAPATVTYAGDAPGEVEGVFQVNFQVPSSVPPDQACCGLPSQISPGEYGISLNVSGESPYSGGSATLWVGQ
jgi:hypothetical protein